ncbi:MAG: twin-arginine translocase TatA/TatE family subunit [Actinomycetia bacterium]|jgi:sec-independent protein translocase protein TatA|nr:twin-arginine translocase TatA/TatE family subunit [Actinomycetes bacterium]
MGSLSPAHWAIVAIVVLVLFGSKKLPDAARGLGRSMRIFKSETKGLMGDEEQAQRPAELNGQSEQLKDRAAELRAEAARLEREATAPSKEA